MNWLDWIRSVLGRARPVPVPPPPGPGTPPPPVGDVPGRLRDAHNAARPGRTAFLRSAELEAAAQTHANLMAARHMMSHQLPGEPDPFRRMSDAGYRYGLAAENVAGGQTSVEQVMADWMLSPGHRANILGSYAHMGGAMAAAADGTRYWSVSFASPAAGGFAAAAAAPMMVTTVVGVGGTTSSIQIGPRGGS